MLNFFKENTWNLIKNLCPISHRSVFVSWLPKLRRQSAHCTSLSAAMVLVFSSSPLLVWYHLVVMGMFTFGKARPITSPEPPARPSYSTITFICFLTPVPFTFLCWASHIQAGSRQQHQHVMAPAGDYLQQVMVKVNSGSAKTVRAGKYQSWDHPCKRHWITLNLFTMIQPLITCAHTNFWITAILNVYAIHNS